MEPKVPSEAEGLGTFGIATRNPSDGSFDIASPWVFSPFGYVTVAPECAQNDI
jgi:hypothetical protein